MSQSKFRSSQPTLADAVPFGRPEVIVDFIFSHGLFHVAVDNLGDGAAYCISVKFDKKFYGLGGELEISSLSLFRNIEFLAPKKRIETFLDSSNAYFHRAEPTRLIADIAFRDAQQRLHERRIIHDLGIYRDLAYLVHPSEAMSMLTPLAPSAGGSFTVKEKTHGNFER